MPEGVDIYSVSTSPDPNAQFYPPSDWLADEGWPVTVLVDSAAREAGVTFGLAAFPFSVFVYADGTIAARATGAIPYEGFLDAVQYLAEHPNG